MLTADFDGQQVLIQYYTAKTLPSPFFALLYFRRLEKRLPSGAFVRCERITVAPQLLMQETKEKKTENNGKASEKASKDKNIGENKNIKEKAIVSPRKKERKKRS